jgi:predicted DNA-binding transcriptional regulator YafY
MSDENLFDISNATEDQQRVYKEIEAAIIQVAPRTIRFTYTSGKGEESKRHVEPYKIVGGKDGLNPQLMAWDVDKDAMRRFSLDGMEGISQGDTFTARAPIEIMC